MSSLHENSSNKNYIPIITSSRQDNADVLLIKEAVSKSFQISKKYLFKKLCSFGYFIKKRIGEGSYSKVYAGEYIKEIEKDQQNLLKMKPVAFKIIDKRNTSADFSKKFLPRELDILKNIKHPYIVKIFSIFEIGPLIAICMDYCQYGDLLKYIQKNGILNEKQAKIFFKQICSAVQYLHEKDIAHRDIKCENVLIHHRLYVKITDFGFARKMDKLCKGGSFSSTFCGSTAYAAPEVLRGIPYEPKLYDTWSLGCVLFIMLFGVMPFDDKNVLQTIKKQENYDINFPKDKRINVRVKDLIGHLLDPDVKTRYFIGEIMAHIWLGIIKYTQSITQDNQFIFLSFFFNNNP